MLLGQVDANVIAALITGGVTMFLGLLGVTWKLGALSNRVGEMKQDVHDLREDIKDLRRRRQI